MTGGGTLRDDRVESATRWLAAIIVPFLVVAAVLLIGRPASTDRTFAWAIAPPATAMMLGAAYVGGAYFFLRVVVERRWHRVALGFPPVIAFAALLGVATALHWDRFNHGHVAFVTWAVLYFTTPVLVTAVWWRNRRTDPGVPEQGGDGVLSGPLPVIVGAVGVAASLVAVAVFVRPELLSGTWPWATTPLTGRVLAALFALQGVIGIGVVVDRRWSSVRIVAETALVMLAAVMAGALRGAGDAVGGGRMWSFAIGLAALVALWAAVYATMEVRRRTGEDIGGRLPHPPMTSTPLEPR